MGPTALPVRADGGVPRNLVWVDSFILGTLLAYGYPGGGVYRMVHMVAKALWIQANTRAGARTLYRDIQIRIYLYPYLRISPLSRHIAVSAYLPLVVRHYVCFTYSQ